VDHIDRLLSRSKERARGWMPLPVYRKLFDSAAACGGGTIVEIGTFCGAATIAMALGAKSAGKPFQIITADLLRPGIGLAGGPVDAKVAALRASLAEFGVADAVRFVHGSVETLVAQADPRDIGLLLLDGGGRIESDFAALWDRLAPGAAIVIDDVDGRVTVERDLRRARINQKHLLSKLLVERFVAAGMLAQTGMILSTGWYRKSGAAPSPDEIRLMALPAYHRLIHVEIGEGEFGLPRALARRLAARAPLLRKAWRAVRPAR
jgi:predicted O-methyltransferase YrrM